MENYGIPIFLINMECSSKRLRDVKRQLDALNLRFSRIDATVGAELSDQDIELVYDSKRNKSHHHRDLTKGEIGCYISHRKAWQAIIDQESEFALVLEDDISVNNNIIDCFKLIDKSEGWDILKLSDTENVKVANSKRLNSEFELVSYNKVPNRTMAYLITRQAAKKMLSQTRFFRPVDVDVQCYADFGISVCGLRPNCVEMSEEFGTPDKSDIAKVNKGRHSSRSTLVRNLKYRFTMHNRRKHTSYDLSQFKLDRG